MTAEVLVKHTSLMVVGAFSAFDLCHHVLESQGRVCVDSRQGGSYENAWPLDASRRPTIRGSWSFEPNKPGCKSTNEMAVCLVISRLR